MTTNGSGWKMTMIQGMGAIILILVGLGVGNMLSGIGLAHQNAIDIAGMKVMIVEIRSDVKDLKREKP